MSSAPAVIEEHPIEAPFQYVSMCDGSKGKARLLLEGNFVQKTCLFCDDLKSAKLKCELYVIDLLFHIELICLREVGRLFLELLLA